MATSSKSPSKQRRTEMLAEFERLQAIFDSMDDGVYIVGRDHRIEFVNRALRRDLGDGVGQFCHEFFGHDASTCHHCQHEMGSFGPELRREWRFPATRKTYDVIVSPLHQPHGAVSRLHLLRDITERKQLEAQLQEYSQNLEAKVAEQAERLRRKERLAVLGEISAGLAHEIRTPLGAIITGIRLLEKGEQAPEERELVFALLKRETGRLERKVREFLSYARVRLPQVKATRVVSLLKEVRSILTTDCALLGDVVLEIKAAAEVGTWSMDAEQIKEVLLNLGINALQSLHGRGILSIEARCCDGVLELLVCDNGPGIPAEVLSQVFKPFYSCRPGGTGLGLAICQQIIESHGGRICATSDPGRRTAFTVRLNP
jgi:two-component system, NtrC family, sensor histidine kinase HydH